MTFTADVRDELAHAPVGAACCRRAELAAVLRLGGSLALRGGSGIGWRMDSASGAVARRVRTSALALCGVAASVEVHRPGGLRRATTYRVRLGPEAAGLLVDLGLVDGRGRPGHEVPERLCARSCDESAYLRGALIGAASISAPARPPHLEFAVASPEVAAHLGVLLHRTGAPSARSGRHGEAWRLVVKSSDQVAALLARAGAHDAFLRFDAARLQRELRGAANRAANADRANLARAVGAAGRHIAAIERLGPQLQDLDPLLRELALARIANPEASLAELGSLLDPPVGKATVHRRLQRLLALADGAA